jgi:outer membrane protein TolC
VRELLAKTLSVDDAVQIALLNNRGLQASLATLGIADAELLEASRLHNPGLTLTRPQSGGALSLEHSLHYSLARLVMFPFLRDTEQSRFEQTQRAVALDVLTLAADARKAYYSALAANEMLRYTQQVQTAAEASAELARRMTQAGNFNKLQQAREQAFYADAALNASRAQQAIVSARERLTRLMGLWGDQTNFVLPERLPDVPTAIMDRPDIERQALSQRLDVLSDKFGAERMARNLGLTRRTRFINLLDLGVVRSASETGRAQLGYELTIELPLFDWGESRIEKAEAFYMQAVNRAAHTAVNARSEVREAYQAYRAAYDIARHFRDEIVPTAKRISEENMLRYNGMLIGVFELLADARAQITSVNGTIAARRDFWIAEADLNMAMVGKPSLAQISNVSAAGSASGASGAH